MSLPVACPFCQKQYLVPENMAGKPAVCPGCKKRFQVPDANARAILEAAQREIQQDAAAGVFNAPPPPPAAASAPDANTCPACGAKIPRGSRICITCGQNLFGPSAAAGDAASDARHASRQPRSATPALLFTAAAVIAFLMSLALRQQQIFNETLIAALAAVLLGFISLLLLWRLGELALILLGGGAAIGGIVVTFLTLAPLLPWGKTSPQALADAAKRAAEQEILHDFQALQSPDLNERLAAAQRLLEHPPADHKPLLERLLLIPPLPESDPRRAAIADCLVALLLRDPKPDPRAYADALGHWQTAVTPAALITALQADPPPDESRRHVLIVSLGGLRSPVAAPVLAGYLGQDAGAAEALAAIGPAAEEAVIPILHSADDGAALEACQVLQHIGTSAKSGPALEALIGTTSNPTLLAAARRALAFAQKRPAIAPL